jgi:hypothetical protein
LAADSSLVGNRIKEFAVKLVIAVLFSRWARNVAAFLAGQVRRAVEGL